MSIQRWGVTALRGATAYEAQVGALWVKLLRPRFWRTSPRMIVTSGYDAPWRGSATYDDLRADGCPKVRAVLLATGLCWRWPWSILFPPADTNDLLPPTRVVMDVKSMRDANFDRSTGRLLTDRPWPRDYKTHAEYVRAFALWVERGQRNAR